MLEPGLKARVTAPTKPTFSPFAPVKANDEKAKSKPVAMSSFYKAKCLGITQADSIANREVVRAMAAPRSFHQSMVMKPIDARLPFVRI